MDYSVRGAPVIGERSLDFYDPNGHYTGPLKPFGTQRISKYLIKNRTDPVELPTQQGLEPVHGKQLIAVEMAHAMLIADGDFTQAWWLGLSENRLIEATQTANFGARQIVRAIIAAKDVLFEQNPELYELSEERDSYHLLTAGAILAAVSHRGQYRLSGLPYLTHTIACAGIAGIAARFEGDVFDDRETLILRRGQYKLLNHDGWENGIPSKGPNRARSFLSTSHVVATPLVHYMLLQELGLSAAESLEDARDIYMLTKSVGPERTGRMRYARYEERLSLHPTAAALKLVDIHDNLTIDPKRVEPIDIGHKVARSMGLTIKNQQNNYAKVFTNLESLVLESNVDPMILRIARNVRNVKHEDLDLLRQPAHSIRILNQFDNNKLLNAYDQGQLRLAA